MSPPVATVLLPTRNAERTVARAVESLLAGTLRRVRVLVVDDGSTDGTRGAGGAGGTGRPGGGARRRSRGLVAALNLALSQATSPYVARMDADDGRCPAPGGERRGAGSGPGLGGVGTGVELFREDQPVSPSMRDYAGGSTASPTPERLHRERFVVPCHPSVCLRREALVAAGGWEHGDFPEDYDLWLKLIDRGHRMSSLPEVLFRWRDSTERLTRTDGTHTSASSG